ncbi:MAG: hypothetical protein ACYC65_05945 [Candidatus Limnocylindrales bacterium]
MHVRIGEAATTLVWIDSEEAIIVRWADRATVERIHSDVPGRHRSTGHVRVDPTVRHGGGSGPEDAERARRAHLAAFVEDVAERLPPDGDVLVVGPGMVRERLERSLRADDRRLGRHRHVHAAASERLTEQELVAHVRELAGDAPRRRGLPV